MKKDKKLLYILLMLFTTVFFSCNNNGPDRKTQLEKGSSGEVIAAMTSLEKAELVVGVPTKFDLPD